MCGWFHTRGTWEVCFFPGVVGGLLYAIAQAKSRILYLKQKSHHPKQKKEKNRNSLVV